MRIEHPALGALLLMATLGGCAGSGANDEASADPAGTLSALPEGVHWRLQQSSIPGLMADSEGAIHLSFAEGRISGDSGCNRFFADAAIVQGRLQLGPIGASKRACIGPRMDAEVALFAALSQLDGASIVDGKLRLVTRDGAEMHFVDDPTVAE